MAPVHAAQPCLLSGSTSLRNVHRWAVRQLKTSAPHAARNNTLQYKGLRCKASGSDESFAASTSAALPGNSTDPFVAASVRLRNMLDKVGSGEEEMLDKLVAEEAPEIKMQTNISLAGIITVVAVVVATLCGKDPWGGASLSFNSLCMAAVGVIASLPLVASRLWSWSPAAVKLIPALEDMHLNQLQVHTPWFMRMSQAHVALMMALEVLPMTLLLFPAAQGMLATAVDIYSQVMQKDIGSDPPSGLVAAGALLFTATIASIGRNLELSASEEEYAVVQTALENADRFYRLTAMNMNSRSEDAQRASLAFKAVAQTWLDTRSEACMVAGAITFVDVLFLGGLWYATGDLTAPAVAALAANWVDYHYLHQAVMAKERKRA